MTVVAALYFVACGLLVVAGAAKVLHPAVATLTMRRLHLPSTAPAVRVVGFGEIAFGAGGAVAGSTLAPLVAALYLVFAAASAGAVRTGAPCGCFGVADTRTTPGHLVTDITAAAVSLAMAVGTGPDLGDVFAEQPLGGFPFVVLVVAAVWLVYLALTWLPVASRAATPIRSFTLRARNERA